MAITTLAGSNLVAAAQINAGIESLLTATESATLTAWATATFWFLLTIAIGVWSRVDMRVTPDV